MGIYGNHDAGSAVNVRKLTGLAVDALTAAGFRSGEESALLDIPVHKNVGDSLITLGELQLLAEFPKSRLAHMGLNRDQPRVTMARMPKFGNILLHGGGNFGDLWAGSQDYRLQITENAPSSCKVIWLPQSIHFENSQSSIFERTRKVLDEYRPAVLLRDTRSMKIWQESFSYEAYLCPDLGLIADVSNVQAPPYNRRLNSNSEVHLVRQDRESRGSYAVAGSVDWVDAPTGPKVRTLMKRIARRLLAEQPTSLLRRSLEQASFTYLTRMRVRGGVELLRGAEIILSDRLHACILGLLLGKKVVAHENSYGKIAAVLNTWEDFVQKDHLSWASGVD